MSGLDVRRSVDLVTGKARPDDAERAMLIAGDARLMATLISGYRPSGRKLPEIAPGDIRPTVRRREVAELTLQGLSVKEIAAELGISTHTVETHLSILRKRTGEQHSWRAAAVFIAGEAA